MAITINQDTTFLICDEVGNIPQGAELGLYHHDSRFLSRYELTLDDQAPLLLAARPTHHYAAAHFLTNPALSRVPRGLLGLVRRRLIGQGLHEDLDVTNHGDEEAVFNLELRFDADFAHIFEVKRDIHVAKEETQREGDFGLSLNDEGRSLRFQYQRGDLVQRLIVNFSERPSFEDGCCRFALRLAPHQQWHLCLDFLTLDRDEEGSEPAYPCRGRDGSERLVERERRYAETVRQAPRLHTNAYVLRRAYEQSVRDFVALSIKGEEVLEGEVAIAAGIPWYMALFGRDALITAYQALPFYPEAAKGVLRSLARHQGTQVGRLGAEEPGKIVHEYRYGTLPGRHRVIPTLPYYGTVDATPLFLVLAAAVFRLTGDLDFASSFNDSVRRALGWMDEYGDRDGDGYIEYINQGEEGLTNHGWKDSADSVRFRDGQIARPPIALCEVQGYAYAAYLGAAEMLAALDEAQAAARLREQAGALKRAFNRDFWLPERSFYAEALDGQKRPVDALTSNAGHLLWSGIAEPEKARLVAQRLLAEEFFSGWGVRTMATTEGGYNPISYHNGSVWPHDNSLIVAGLVRYGFLEEATRIVDGLLAALAHYPDHRLPELFAGYSREETPFPVEYPTASRPQAWASGSIFLLLTAMLGVDPDDPARAPRAPFLPPGVRELHLRGLWLGRPPCDVEVWRSDGDQVERRISSPSTST